MSLWRRVQAIAESDGAQYLAGAFALVFVLGYVVKLNLDVRESAVTWRWPSTTGEIVGSNVDVRTHSSSQSRRTTTSYVIELEYRYEVDGREHRSRRIGINAVWSFDTRAAAEAEIARVSAGPLAVYYDPEDPSQALLVRGVTASTDISLVGTILMLAAVVGLIAHTYFKRRRPRPIRAALFTGAGAGAVMLAIQYGVYVTWLSA